MVSPFKEMSIQAEMCKRTSSSHTMISTTLRHIFIYTANNTEDDLLRADTKSQLGLVILKKNVFCLTALL